MVVESGLARKLVLSLVMLRYQGFRFWMWHYLEALALAMMLLIQGELRELIEVEDLHW